MDSDDIQEITTIDDIREIISIDDWSQDLSELSLHDGMLSPETAALVQQSLGEPIFSDSSDEILIIGASEPEISEDVNFIDNDILLISSQQSSQNAREPTQDTNQSQADEQTVLTIGQSNVNNYSNNTSNRRFVIRNNHEASANQNSDNYSVNDSNSGVQNSIPYQHDNVFLNSVPGSSNRRHRRSRTRRTYHGGTPSRRLILNGVPITSNNMVFQTPNSIDNLSYENLVEMSDSVQLLVGQGMSKSAINQHTLTSVYSPESDTSRDQSCSICLNDFVANKKIRTLPCFHRFHVRCIDQWLVRKSECPVCRVDVENPSSLLL